jgi:hypothetical protein
MKLFFTKKVLVIITVLSLVLAMGAGVYADSALKQISAYQNSALSITVNGKAIDISSPDGPLYPIVYAGHSYVPAKSLAEALGAKVDWNARTQTVEVVTQNVYLDPFMGEPTKDVTVPSATPNVTADHMPVKPARPTGGEGNPGEKVRVINYLNADFNKEEQGAKVKVEAMVLLRAYAKALTTEDTNNLDKVINALVIEKSSDNGLLGKEYTRNNIHEQLKATIAAGSAKAVADDILKISDDTVKSTDIVKSDTSVIFSYKMQRHSHQGLDTSVGTTNITATVTFTFTKVNDKYLLNTLNIL